MEDRERGGGGGDCAMPRLPLAGTTAGRQRYSAYEDISDEEEAAQARLLPLRVDTRGHHEAGESLGPASAPCLGPGTWPGPCYPLAGYYFPLTPRLTPDQGAATLSPVQTSAASPHLLPATPAAATLRPCSTPASASLLSCSTPAASSLQSCSTPRSASSHLSFSISNILGEKEAAAGQSSTSTSTNTSINFELSSTHPTLFHSATSTSTAATEDSGYDSSRLSQSQVAEESEDSYIDVVGLDEEEEEEAATKQSVVTPSPTVTVERAGGDTAADTDIQAASDTAPDSGDQALAYDIKKKMFDNWYKSKQSHETGEKGSTKDQITVSEYRHKKIRRTSLEHLDTLENLESGEGGGKKKTFLLDRYQLNTNINKNKRKEEKWSQSETDSPDKKKDQHKLKKKHKSHKEERWKISKTIKSPMRLPHEPSPGDQQVRSCSLDDSDLLEGLRLLLRVGSHFYAGRLAEISPPDIYGIIIDKERGNKPHIFSRQEIIKDAILETRPGSVCELERGRRVCVYWSSQLSYLHPGTVTGPDFDSQYVLVHLDDGDSRDVHIDQVRYLPDNYPHVDSTLGAATELEFFGGRKGNDYLNEIRKEKTRSRRSKKKERSAAAWSVVVTEVVDGNDNYEANFEAKQQQRSQAEAKMEDDQDSAFESDGYKGDSDCEGSVGRGGGGARAGITAFLPPQHRLWRWADPGHKLSAKSRRVYHSSIARDLTGTGEEAETVSVGDCAVFLSTGRPDRPYIGRIHAMWQTAVAGNMRVQVKWFYHPAEVEGTVLGGGSLAAVSARAGALFSSGHSDENDVQTISHKCQVLASSSSSCSGEDGGDIYTLVGDYDPIVGTVTLL